jgi:hypothetical protein
MALEWRYLTSCAGLYELDFFCAQAVEGIDFAVYLGVRRGNLAVQSGLLVRCPRRSSLRVQSQHLFNEGDAAVVSGGRA